MSRIDDWSPEVGSEEKLCAAEVGRRDAYDCEGVLVDLDGAAYDGAVAVEFTAPESVAENDFRHAVLAMFLRGVDEPAGIGLDAEGIEVIGAHHVGPDHGRIAVAVFEPDAAHDVVGDQGIEAAIPVPEVAVIRIGLGWRST